MKVTVRYFAVLREIINSREETLEVDENTTVLGLLDVLAARHGSRFVDYVFDPMTGSPRTYLQFLLDGESVAGLKGLSTVLTDQCILAIVPPVGGG